MCIDTTKTLKPFTFEQIMLLKSCAQKLLFELKNSKRELANSFLNGELGEILNQVMIINTSDVVLPFTNIPYFELMTRDYFAEIEIEYFNFYSVACFGELAYKAKKNEII